MRAGVSIVTLFILCLCLPIVVSCRSGSPENIDDHALTRFQAAKLVVKAMFVRNGEGSKYVWDEIRIISVLKNESSVKVEEGITLEIARYSFAEESNYPKGIFIVYLVPYGDTDPIKWKLLGGTMETGTSGG